MALKRISTEAGARKLMQRLIDAGRCTLEDFDAPPPGHINPAAYRNLLRDPEPEPTVQLSDPRDFTPTQGATPAQPLDLPLTPELPTTAEEFDF
jgi:hypothetical protein